MSLFKYFLLFPLFPPLSCSPHLFSLRLSKPSFTAKTHLYHPLSTNLHSHRKSFPWLRIQLNSKGNYNEFVLETNSMPKKKQFRSGWFLFFDRVWSSMSLNESVYGFVVGLEFKNVCIWEMFRFIAPSPMIPKIINLHLTFLFTHNIDQPPKYEPREPEDNININRSYCTKKIHRLCAKDRNVDKALRLVDYLNLWGYRPLSQHQHHHSRRLPSNHFYSLSLLIASPTSILAMFLLLG